MRTKKILAVLTVLLVISCATTSFQKAGYDILSTAKVTYDTTLSALGALQKQGKLSDSDVQKVLSVARPYYLAYRAALAAYNVYYANPTPQTQADFTKLLGDVSTQLALFIPILDQYMIETTNLKLLQTKTNTLLKK